MTPIDPATVTAIDTGEGWTPVTGFTLEPMLFPSALSNSGRHFADLGFTATTGSGPISGKASDIVAVQTA